MVATGQRSTVHGVMAASLEWERIVELAFRRGLAALPSSRPAFAVTDRPATASSDPDSLNAVKVPAAPEVLTAQTAQTALPSNGDPQPDGLAAAS
jgi:hypothetical protein